MRDPYEVLAVPRSATTDEIRKAFRRLAKKLHPDANKNNPEAGALFAELKAAREILVDEETRKAFDRGELDAEGNPTLQGVAPTTASTSHIVTSLMMVMIMLTTTATLIMQGGDRRPSVLSRLGADEKYGGVSQTKRPDFKDLSGPHLILQPKDLYSVDGTVPLGIQVSSEAVGVSVQISNLPAEMRITSGRAQGGGWRIPAMDLANATINPPPGFSGTIDLAVELRLADDSVADRALLRFEWLQTPAVAAVPIDSPGDIAGADAADDKVAAAPAPADQNAIAHATQSQLDYAKIEPLSEHNQQLASENDAGWARTLPRPPVDARDTWAALALAGTNGPTMPSILPGRGVAAEVSLARQKASEFGSGEAQRGRDLLTAALTPIERTRRMTASDSGRGNVTPPPAANPKRRIAGMPTHLPERPEDRYHVHVAGAHIGNDLAPLMQPPAFLQ